MKILSFFQFFWVIFALLDPDPDPAAQINADPCGSGSETLIRPVTRAWASYHYQVFVVVYPRVLRTALIWIKDCSIGYGTAPSVWTGGLYRTLGMEMAYCS
jgi:hypothetical protein